MKKPIKITTQMLETDRKQLKRKLSELRENANLTQKELAKYLNLDYHTIQDAENTENDKYPSTKTIRSYCLFFGCDMDYLFGRIGSSTHDIEYICKETGLSEEAINNLKPKEKDFFAMYKGVIALNIILENDPYILNYIANYFDPYHSFYVAVSNPVFSDFELDLDTAEAYLGNEMLDSDLYRQATINKLQMRLDKISETIAPHIKDYQIHDKRKVVQHRTGNNKK